MGVILVSTNSGVLNEWGVKYQEGFSAYISKSNIFYYGENLNVEPITLQFALIDKNGFPAVWTLEKRKEIIDWLVTKDFCPFVSEDDTSVVHYFKCTEYKKVFTHEGKGILEVVMQPESQYAYTPVIQHYYKVDGECEFDINNIGNVEEKYYPKIEIIQLSDTYEDVVVENKSIYKEGFTICNLNQFERVVSDHLLKSVSSNMESFRLKDTNRKWLYLRRGINNISVRGNCEIKIITQYPLKV